MNIITYTRYIKIRRVTQHMTFIYTGRPKKSLEIIV